VIQAFLIFLLCVAPHPVLGFLTGPCPVSFAGRNHYKHVAVIQHVASLQHEAVGLKCFRPSSVGARRTGCGRTGIRTGRACFRHLPVPSSALS